MSGPAQYHEVVDEFHEFFRDPSNYFDRSRHQASRQQLSERDRRILELHSRSALALTLQHFDSHALTYFAPNHNQLCSIYDKGARSESAIAPRAHKRLTLPLEEQRIDARLSVYSDPDKGIQATVNALQPGRFLVNTTLAPYAKYPISEVSVLGAVSDRTLLGARLSDCNFAGTRQVALSCHYAHPQGFTAATSFTLHPPSLLKVKTQRARNSPIGQSDSVGSTVNATHLLPTLAHATEESQSGIGVTTFSSLSHAGIPALHVSSRDSLKQLDEPTLAFSGTYYWQPMQLFAGIRYTMPLTRMASGTKRSTTESTLATEQALKSSLSFLLAGFPCEQSDKVASEPSNSQIQSPAAPYTCSAEHRRMNDDSLPPWISPTKRLPQSTSQLASASESQDGESLHITCSRAVSQPSISKSSVSSISWMFEIADWGKLLRAFSTWSFPSTSLWFWRAREPQDTENRPSDVKIGLGLETQVREVVTFQNPEGSSRIAYVSASVDVKTNLKISTTLTTIGDLHVGAKLLSGTSSIPCSAAVRATKNWLSNAPTYWSFQFGFDDCQFD